MSAFDEVTADDSALDALGRGEAAPEGDRLLGMLATWRADLAEGEGAPAIRPAVPVTEDVPDVAEVLPLAPRRHRRRRMLVAAAAAAVLAAGISGVAAAGSARPGDTLWPVTKLVYSDRAASVQAEIATERALRRAETAAAEGRTAEAAEHLATADEQLGRVTSSDAAKRLRERADRLRENDQRVVVPPAPGTTPKPPAGGTAPARPTPSGPVDNPGDNPGDPGNQGGGDKGKDKGRDKVPATRTASVTTTPVLPGNGNGNGHGRNRDQDTAPLVERASPAATVLTTPAQHAVTKPRGQRPASPRRATPPLTIRTLGHAPTSTHTSF
ncbi:hypothetical protein [Longispora albida]|uniref:hypothetical protein n=1 Tax=Longispora albida TaxID=203523 RepID=UPI0003810727|nr:hypothetical protein [Longispora albida]